MKNLLPGKKQYKVNLHSHTSISDGRLSPGEIKELYKNAGYSAVAFTDHDILIPHNDLTDSDFVALNGYEYKINDKSLLHAGNKYKSFHINMIAKTPDIDTQVCFNPSTITPEAARFLPFVKYVGDIYTPRHTPDGVNEVSKIAGDHGFLVHYNHPLWSMHDQSDLDGITGFDGIELINTGSIVTWALPEDTDIIYEYFLRSGRFPYPLACDDNHNHILYGKTDALSSFNMIFADRLDYVSLVSALEKGNTYASSGPIINTLASDGGKITVEAQNAVEIIMRTKGRRAVRAACGDGINRAVFEVQSDDGYIRFVLTGADGSHAYTRAYGLEEL